MHCDNMCALIYGLGIYSVVLTVLLVSMVIYACKKRTECIEYSKTVLSYQNDKDAGDLVQLRHPVETDYFLPKSPTTLKPNQQSIYDSTTSSSFKGKDVIDTNTNIASSAQGKPPTLNQEQNSRLHYDTIIESVVTTLSELHDRPKDKAEAEIFDMFLEKLTMKIQKKNPSLYNSLRRHSQYSFLNSKDLGEETPAQYNKLESDDDDDDIYVRYLGPQNRDKSYMPNKKQFVPSYLHNKEKSEPKSHVRGRNYYAASSITAHDQRREVVQKSIPLPIADRRMKAGLKNIQSTTNQQKVEDRPPLPVKTRRIYSGGDHQGF